MTRKPIRVFRKGSVVPRPVPADDASEAAFRPVRIARPDDSAKRLMITQRILPLPILPDPDPEADDRNAAYDDLLHAIYDAVLLTDLNGMIREVNARTPNYFLRDADELLKMNILDLIAAADARLLLQVRENADADRYTVIEASCRRRDDSLFPAEIVANRFRLQGPSGLCFFVRDITSRREAEDQLVDANRRLIEAEKIAARLETISTLFHELNSPLQALLLMAELDGNDDARRELNRILHTLQELRRETPLPTAANTGQDESPRYELPPAPAPAETAGPVRILVVDDDPTVRQLLKQAVLAAFPNVEIDTASDGAEAVDRFLARHHTLAIMDLAMPRLSGAEAFETIQTACSARDWDLPPFIFCTGYDVPERLSRYLAEGSPHVCLTKPVRIQDLVAAVGARLPRPAA